jgi:hypothetical protein
MRLRFNNINKLNILQAYPAAREQVFIIQNTQSSFRAARIVPFKPKEVLKELNLKVITLIPLPSQGDTLTSSLIIATPHCKGVVPGSRASPKSYKKTNMNREILAIPLEPLK